MITRLLQGCDERLYGLACVRSNVCLAEVDGSGVLTLELEPCVYDGLSLDKRFSLSPTKFPLVHVFSFLLVVALGLIMPRSAIAEVHWEDKSVESYYGYVYPIKYTSWTADAPYALAEYAGFDYDSFSTQVSDALYEQDNGDNPWTRALGETYNMAYGLGEIDAGGGGGGHAFGEPEADGGGAGHYFGWIVEASRLYGYDSIWRINLTKSEYEELRAYIKKWALPREGGGTTISEESIKITLSTRYAEFAGYNIANAVYALQNRFLNYANKHYYFAEQGVLDNVKIRYPNSQFDNAVEFPESGELYLTRNVIGDDVWSVRNDYDWYYSAEFNTSNKPSGSIFLLPKSGYVLEEEVIKGSYCDLYTVTLTVKEGFEAYSIYYANGFNNAFSNLDDSYTIISTTKIHLGNKVTGNIVIRDKVPGYIATVSNIDYVPSPDQPTPAPQQPEEPEEPDKTPDAPIQWPVITWPTIDWPDITVIVPGTQPSGTTPQDYTPWLRQIDDDIRLYGDGIVAALGDLHDDLEQGFSDLLTGINIVTRYVMHFGEQWTLHCDHITDSIDDGFYGLKTYFGANIRWLVGEVGADLDDMQSSVVSWLKRIYSRIRGYPSSKPSYDDDPAGWADWFVDTITDILGGVIGGAASVAGQALTLFQRITGLFPFSLPWDMYAILLLFETPAQAPQFSIDWQLMGDLRIAFDVDCTPWDGTMQAVRAVEFVAFCGGLAKLSVSIVKDMYGLYRESTIT